MAKFNIHAGSSWHRRISIRSDKFVASTSYSPGTGYKTKVKPVSKTTHWLAEHRRWPIPITLRLLIGVLNEIPFKVVIGYALFILALSLPRHYVSPDALSPLRDSWVFAAARLPSWVNIAIWAFCLAYFFRKYIGSWHGAEHMAIETYWAKEQTSLDEIRKQSRISDKCGGRLFFPLITASWLLPSLVEPLLHAPGICSLLVTELVLQIDHWVGWDRIPISREAGRLLQRVVTTRQPGETELLTAKHSIDAVIEMHECSDVFDTDGFIVTETAVA